MSKSPTLRIVSTEALQKKRLLKLFAEVIVSHAIKENEKKP
jgi:hypothetical protein